MKGSTSSRFRLVFLMVALPLLGSPALAQRGGGGGGGTGGGSNSNRGGRYNLLFDYAPAIGGKSPAGSGSYSISTYVTAFNLSPKAFLANLPDGTPLSVAVYCTDFYTLRPWAPISAGTMAVSRQSATLSALGLIITSPGLLPVVTSVTVTAPDGSVVLGERPQG